MNGWLVVDEVLDVFDALRANQQVRADAEVRELALIAQACDEYVVGEAGAHAACERLVDGGADGTPLVGEFLALELAGLLGLSPAAAALRIRGVLDLRHRHPELWVLVHRGGIPPWQALKVAAQCSSAGLSADAARWVDRQLGAAVGALGWTRVQRMLPGLIVRADPEAAAERARQQRERRLVHVGDHADGGSMLYARLDTGDALALEATIARIADALALVGDPDVIAPRDQRRARALGVLADPQAALDLLAGVGDGLPTNRRATVIVHTHADTDVARVDEAGAFTPDGLRRLLAGCRVTVRPVVDLNTIPAADAYEVPDRLREVVTSRNPVEVFPFSARRARGCDLDHTVPFDHTVPYDHTVPHAAAPPGSKQTRPDNLGPLSRKVHRAKTAGLWQVSQSEPGVFRWTSPQGFRYEVSPQGTVALGRPERAAAPTRARSA